MQLIHVILSEISAFQPLTFSIYDSGIDLATQPERRLGRIERRRVPAALPAGQLEARAPKPLAVRARVM
jgi:hypothetical protein